MLFLAKLNVAEQSRVGVIIADGIAGGWMILAYPKVRVLSWIFLAVSLLQAGLAVDECRDKMTEAVEDDIRVRNVLRPI
ncbi:MAG: hypothetical protein WCA56_11500 [Xanthobacteraceae bacterium]